MKIAQDIAYKVTCCEFLCCVRRQCKDDEDAEDGNSGLEDCGEIQEALVTDVCQNTSQYVN